MQELVYLLALRKIDGVGNILAVRLLRAMGSAEAIFQASVKKLMAVSGIHASVAKAIIGFRDFEIIEEEVTFIHEQGIECYSIVNEEYPYNLKHCYDAPYLVFYKGTSIWEKRNIISIVGTRKMSDYGRWAVERIVQDLAIYNPIIVSGLALGVDIAAHKAALEAGLETIGVVAHGLDTIYPAAHRKVAKKMEQQGGILTEYWSKTIPDRENFPSRNRIIAGIAQATLVIEAAEQGGALITANLANTYNREVFALPGRVNDLYSAGCNNIIRNNSAQLITSGEDIALFLGWKKTSMQNLQLFEDLSEDERTILSMIQENPMVDIDQLIFISKKEQAPLTMLLLELEMKNKIITLPGKKFRIK